MLGAVGGVDEHAARLQPSDGRKRLRFIFYRDNGKRCLLAFADDPGPGSLQQYALCRRSLPLPQQDDRPILEAEKERQAAHGRQGLIRQSRKGELAGSATRSNQSGVLPPTNCM